MSSRRSISTTPKPSVKVHDPEPHGELTPTEFCASLWGPLVGTLTVKLGDSEVAKELAQEALAKAWQRWPELQDMDSPDRWVFRVALNLSSSWIRRRAAERRAKQRLATAVVSPADPRETLDVREALRALPKREREVITLRYYGGLSTADVAEVLGISVGSVKSASFDARARLRDALELQDSEVDHD